MKVKLVRKELISGNISTFWFQPDNPVRYIAGQYIELYIPHSNPDERKERRWFTLSSSPSEDLLSITTRLIEPRRSTFKKALNNLKIGTEIKILPPMGDFVLPKDESLPLIFIAKGIGITPFRSMLKYLNDNDKKLNIKLIYCVDKPKDVIFKDIIEEATTKFIIREGNISTDELSRYIEDDGKSLIYTAGPERMVETLRDNLIGKGFDQGRLRNDFFHNYD